MEKFYNITHIDKYTLHRQELENVSEQIDIGVNLDVELKFDKHISVKVKKANAIAGLIRRTFSHLDAPLFKKLFITFVRPHLEYGQVIWTPHLKEYKTIMENVQCRATKLVDGFYSHEQLRKPKKPESTIVGFQKTSKRYDRDFQTFPVLRQLYAA